MGKGMGVGENSSYQPQGRIGAGHKGSQWGGRGGKMWRGLVGELGRVVSNPRRKFNDQT